MSAPAFDTDPWDRPDDVTGLGSEESVDTDGEALEIDCLDVRLPCRIYNIRYKVAVASRVPLAVEFLLRLLHDVGDFSETEIAEFFGFSDAEREHVISRTHDQGYIERTNGQVYLSALGRALFDDGAGHPRLGEIDIRHARETFDLISFQSARYQRLGAFEHGFPLLKVADEESVSLPQERIRKVFHRTFEEIQLPRKNINDPVTHLYSVDDVQVRERVWSLVPVSVRLTEDNEIVPNLDRWMSAADLRDRPDVTMACSDLLQRATVSDESVDTAFRLVGECALEQIATYQSREGFDCQDFLDRVRAQQTATFDKASALRVAGTAWTGANRKRIVAAVEKSLSADPAPPRPITAIWWKPSVPHWGCSRAMRGLVETLRMRIGRPDPNANECDSGRMEPIRGEEPENFDLVLITQNEGSMTRRFTVLFDAILTHEGSRNIPPSLELLLVPDCFFIALVHTPLDYGTGQPLPLGVISCDPGHVRNACRVLSELINVRLLTAVHGGRKKDWNRILTDMLSSKS